jgi:hypothetical protein
MVFKRIVVAAIIAMVVLTACGGTATQTRIAPTSTTAAPAITSEPTQEATEDDFSSTVEPSLEATSDENEATPESVDASPESSPEATSESSDTSFF